MDEYPCDTCGYVGQDIDRHIGFLSDLLKYPDLTEWLLHAYVMHRLKLEMRR